MSVINWISKRSKSNKEISINNYIDTNSEFIKNSYLSLIENIKKIKHNNKSLLFYSKFEKKFNLFDIGVIEEKSIP